MAFYLTQVCYASDSFKAMVSDPHDREAAVRQLIEAAGGRLHHLFFSFGEYDAVILSEAPDEVSLAGALMAVGASGAVSKMNTTRLLNSQEGEAAMRKAGEVSGRYRAPGR